MPGWSYAKLTSAKYGRDHFAWIVCCSHAAPMSTGVPTDERETTEEKWNVEARRLFELRTANWKPEARATFGRLLGFITDEAAV